MQYLQEGNLISSLRQTHPQPINNSPRSQWEESRGGDATRGSQHTVQHQTVMGCSPAHAPKQSAGCIRDNYSILFCVETQKYFFILCKIKIFSTFNFTAQIAQSLHCLVVLAIHDNQDLNLSDQSLKALKSYFPQNPLTVL